MVLEYIISIHAEDAAFLWELRNRAIHAPHYNLKDLLKLDDRIQAHMDGLCIAGETGWTLCEAQLGSEQPGEMFAAAVLALETKPVGRMGTLFSLAEAAPAMRNGLCSALGWASLRSARDTASDLLISQSPFHRWLGVACSAMHRIDPGRPLETAIDDPDLTLSARALRGAGELARRDLSPSCKRHLNDINDACRFWAAWSAVLMGDRADALTVIQDFCVTPNLFRERALQLAVRAMPLSEVHMLLETFQQNPADRRALMTSIGIAGDPSRIPWLIQQMMEPNCARLAGESFTLITGIDIAYENLNCKRPADLEVGPTDDPEDERVDLDGDTDLPWPEARAIQRWWSANRNNFQDGVRYFMGAAPDVQQCNHILRRGYQRQRRAAALYRSLLEPDLPLFECRSPAWIQYDRAS